MANAIDSAGSCQTCSAPLAGRQRKFCSVRCKHRDTNNRHQDYSSQQTRGVRRKLALVLEAGGRCVICGYDRNLAALTWHHRKPSLKSFSLDLRAMSNRSEGELRIEVTKCVLLCANCHAEEHFPNLALPLADA